MTAFGIESRMRAVTAWNHARAIAVLPFMNVVVIPCMILVLTRDLDLAWIIRGGVAGTLGAMLGLVALLGGLMLVARSIALFVRRGEGTLAPWDATQRLITEGLYRRCRNPMKAGLFLILLGECVLLESAALVIWSASFALANVLYIRLSEEPGLRARFGKDYEAYCAAVPRWWPRFGTAPSIAQVERP